MMKRLKRQISMLTLLFFMCCFVLPIIPPTPAEAAEGTSLTDAQINAVIDWAYANAYGSAYSNYQCLAYVYQAYHNAIGVNIGPGGSYSSAIEASRNLELHSGEAPRGAIVFWEAAPSNSYYGHAGISVGGGRAISANVTWSKYPDQRVFDHSIEGFLLYDNSGRKLNYIGWAWPYGMGGTDGITPSSIQNNAASNITETNVYLSAKVLNNYQRVTEVGCYLSTDGVNWPYKASDAVNITDAYTNVWYDNTARDFGIALQPGTTYYYKFYAVVNGNYNEGQVGSFSTTGSKNTTPTQPSVPPTSNIDGVTEGIRLTLDGKNIITPVAPIIEHGTTLVPLRVISESLGAQVSCQQDSKTITIQKDDIKIRLQIGNTMVEVNDAFGKTLAVAPQIKDGTTMVPLRFISETLGCEVTWDAANQVIGISTNKQPVKQPELEKKPAMQINQGEKISASSWHTMVVKNDGTLWSWGDNLHGRLGTGSDRPGSSNTPLQIAAGVKSVSASGFRHCMLVKTDGSL